MKIIIPVGPRDASNLALLTQLIVALGKVNQSILIVCVPSQVGNAETARLALMKVCQDVSVVSTEIEFDHLKPWNMGPNRMFYWIVTYLHAQQNREPWLNLEPDCTPMVPQWADRIEADYKRLQKPYYGFVRLTRHRDGNGAIYFRNDDKLMIGGGSIVSPYLMNDAEIMPLFKGLGSAFENSHPPEPWDLWLRWKFFKRGVGESSLVHDKWHTINYRYKGGEIVCDANPDNPTGTAIGGSIPVESVLVHGCKDGSLQRLILAKYVQSRESAGESIAGDTMKVENAIQAILQAGGKPRVADIASLIQMTSAEVKPLILQLGHTIGKAGWVTLKAQ